MSLALRSSSCAVIGCGPHMQAILEFIRMNAKDPSPIAFIGEEGTGRRLMARLLREAGAPDQRVVRIVSPSDQDADGCLRVVLPPLRARREDILLLTDLFLREAHEARGQKPRLVSPSARQALASYDWPGNVRELRETCEWIARTCSCAWIKRGCLPSRLNRPPASTRRRQPAKESRRSLEQQLRDFETGLIKRALVENGYNRSRAARALDVKRSTLGDRIKRLGLVPRP